MSQAGDFYKVAVAYNTQRPQCEISAFWVSVDDTGGLSIRAKSYEGETFAFSPQEALELARFIRETFGAPSV